MSQGSACSTPTKDTLKQYDRAYAGPMVPTRGIFGGSATNTLGTGHLTVGSQHHHHHHYSTPLNFRKGFTSKCTWKCTAILVIMLCVILFSILVYMSGETNGFVYFNSETNLIRFSIIDDELVISIIKALYSTRKRETR